MAAATVVIYTQLGCSKCEAEKAFLKQRGIAFEERNITNDPSALRELLERNIRSTPATRIGDTFLVGFRPNRLLEAIRAEGA